jgi:hypothetical protein
MLTTRLLLLASLLIAATIAQSPYNGAWTTYYGGNFFICVDPSGIMNVSRSLNIKFIANIHEYWLFFNYNG